LDVACGPGNITRYLLDKRPGLRIVGTDLAENMLVLARKNNPEASFCLLDARESTTLNQQFNGILCGFGLPYLSKEEAIQFIHDARSMLLPGGVLYISTMEGEYLQSGWKESSSNPDDKTYTHFHEFEYLNKAFADSGFAVPRVQRKEYVSPNGTTALDLVLVASLPS
jgi:ubiquinone/menaquinone biosynthesis C-methylase UbiE